MEVKSLLYRITTVGPYTSEGVNVIEDVTNEGIKAIQPSSYDRVKEYMLSNPGVKNKDIASNLGIPESTVKVYAAKIRKEPIPDRITDSIPAVV